MSPWSICVGVVAVVAGFVAIPARADEQRKYMVVVSSQSADDAAWAKVVNALEVKHSARVVTYDKHVDETLATVKGAMPRHIAFVATPKEATREFVADVHRLTRKLDDDPYTDEGDYTGNGEIGISDRQICGVLSFIYKKFIDASACDTRY